MAKEKVAEVGSIVLMEYTRVSQISFVSLREHKMRTALTMLGVIFGVGAVIAMLSIGEGAKREALEQISILGINNIIISADAQTSKGTRLSIPLNSISDYNIDQKDYIEFVDFNDEKIQKHTQFDAPVPVCADAPALILTEQQGSIYRSLGPKPIPLLLDRKACSIHWAMPT